MNNENKHNFMGIVIMLFSFLPLLIFGTDGMVISIVIILFAIIVMLSGSEEFTQQLNDNKTNSEENQDRRN